MYIKDNISNAELLFKQIHDYDEQTYKHCLRVGNLMAELCNSDNCPQTVQSIMDELEENLAHDEAVLEIRWAGYLHDIGKIDISHSIICSPIQLTDEQYDVIKSHSENSEHYLNSFSETIKTAAMEHHVKIGEQGKSYPVVGHDPAPIAQLCAICDIYDALAYKRYYKEKMSSEEISKIMHDMTGINPEILSTLENYLQTREHSAEQKIAENIAKLSSEGQAIVTKLASILGDRENIKMTWESFEKSLTEKETEQSYDSEKATEGTDTADSLDITDGLEDIGDSDN